MANHTSSIPSSPIPFRTARAFDDRPAQDEWGMFDPKQAGVEALVRKLLSPHEADRAHDPAAPVKK